MMTARILSAACGLWLCIVSPLFAQSESGVVVELYTSQGCSSCPPADALLHQIADQPGVIALALHVDYWDYIGWKDTFAKPQFTSRQKAYAHEEGSSIIYTPQMILNGQDRIVGNESGKLARALAARSADSRLVNLVIQRQGERLIIRAETDTALAEGVQVQLVRYSPQEMVEIRAGENAGERLTYTNIVTQWQVIGRWSGQSPLKMEADVPGSDPVVVILQHEGPAKVVAAARLK